MECIELSGKDRGKFLICDNEDYKHLFLHKWHLDGRGNYPYTQIYVGNRRCKKLSVADLILEVPDGMEIDHKNRNKLDWRRENLRLCTHSQNNMNKGKYKNNGTKYKGIYYQNSRWKVQIVKSRVMYVLGTFDDEIYAAHIYDAGARCLHGEYAVLNFPDENWFPDFDFNEHRKLVQKRVRKEKLYEYSKS